MKMDMDMEMVMNDLLSFSDDAWPSSELALG